jgi:PAS domain S-box-containing protein
LHGINIVSIQKRDPNYKLRKLEKQYRDLYNSVPIACFTVSVTDGRILDCNKAARKLFDYSKKTILQMNVFDLYAKTPYGLPKAQKVFKDFQVGKTTHNTDLQIKRRGGSFLRVSLSVAPEKYREGKILECRCMLSDISHRKQLSLTPHKTHKNALKLIEKRNAELAEANAQLKRDIKELRQANEALRAKTKLTEIDITAKKRTEPDLIKPHIKVEKHVKERTEQLTEINKALSVLAQNIDQRWEEMQKETARKVNSKILPIIENFQKDKVLANYRTEFDMLESQLNELFSHSSGTPDSIFMLTNAELRIASMIKRGLKSPEIARQLFISRNTVKTHRRNIRKKLDIHNSDINLASYLRAIMR